MEKFNSQIPVRYGIIAFSMAVTIGLLMYVFYTFLIAHFLMYIAIGIISFGLVLFLGIWSAISYRRENAGVISFAHAFLAVFLVFVFSSTGNILTQVLVNKVIDTHYAEKASALMKDKMSDYFDKNNMPEDQAKEALKEMGPEKFDPPFAQLLLSTLKFLGFFGLISAIVAAFIKRGSGDLILTDSQPEPIKTI